MLKSGAPAPSSGVVHAIISTPDGATYRVQQKNTSNPIMLIQPCTANPNPDYGTSALSCLGVQIISTIEDTLELYIQNDMAAVAPAKVNKWHEKFAKSRNGSKSKD